MPAWIGPIWEGFLEHAPDWFVAAFTGLLVFVTWRLVTSTNKLWKAGERQIEIARQVAEITDKQLSVAATQTDILQKQHAVGRLAYLADKRPRLLVRHVVLNPDIIGKIDEPDTVVTGSLVLVNIGNIEAKITRSRYRVFWTDEGLPMDLDLEGEEADELVFSPSDPLAGGGSCSYPFFSSKRLGSDAEDIEDGSCKLYVVGYVKYTDLADIERFMGFCRVYRRIEKIGTSARFIVENDPDYEYQD
jgi:hypothetical protein